jgi:hypothetical protein
MKHLAIALILLCASFLAHAEVIGVTGRVTPALIGSTTTATSNTFQFSANRDAALRAHKASITASAGTATVLVEVNDNIARIWVVACTLNVTAAAPDSCITNAPWPYMRHRVSAVTDATIYSTVME